MKKETSEHWRFAFVLIIRLITQQPAVASEKRRRVERSQRACLRVIAKFAEDSAIKTGRIPAAWW